MHKYIVWPTFALLVLCQSGWSSAGGTGLWLHSGLGRCSLLPVCAWRWRGLPLWLPVHPQTHPGDYTGHSQKVRSCGYVQSVPSFLIHYFLSLLLLLLLQWLLTLILILFWHPLMTNVMGCSTKFYNMDRGISAHNLRSAASSWETWC